MSWPLDAGAAGLPSVDMHFTLMLVNYHHLHLILMRVNYLDIHSILMHVYYCMTIL